MPYKTKDLKFAYDALEEDGISAETLDVHHDRLYDGYVNKRNAVKEALDNPPDDADHFRSLKKKETYVADGAILHELYFDTLGGDGEPTGDVAEKIREDFGDLDTYFEDLRATCGAVTKNRGWVVTAYDPMDGRIHNFLCDAHDQGGVWGSIPIFTIDMYEHAYYMDFANDASAYVEAVLDNVDWDAINERYQRIKRPPTEHT